MVAEEAGEGGGEGFALFGTGGFAGGLLALALVEEEGVNDKEDCGG